MNPPLIVRSPDNHAADIAALFARYAAKAGVKVRYEFPCLQAETTR